MPKIKTKIKIKYLVFDKDDPRTVTKIERMLSTTGYSADCRKGRLSIYSDCGRETIIAEDGHIVYVYQFLTHELVGVMDPPVFYERFQKEVALRQNKKAKKTMQELIIPEHYNADGHGTNGGLVYIYQQFINQLLRSNKAWEGALISALIKRANDHMLAFIYGTAMKYDYRKGKKIYEYRGKEVSEEIDTEKRDFYLAEWSRLVLSDVADGLQIPIYPLLPALVEYQNQELCRISEYLTLITE